MNEPRWVSDWDRPSWENLHSINCFRNEIFHMKKRTCFKLTVSTDFMIHDAHSLWWSWFRHSSKDSRTQHLLQSGNLIIPDVVTISQWYRTQCCVDCCRERGHPFKVFSKLCHRLVKSPNFCPFCLIHPPAYYIQITPPFPISLQQICCSLLFTSWRDHDNQELPHHTDPIAKVIAPKSKSVTLRDMHRLQMISPHHYDISIYPWALHPMKALAKLSLDLEVTQKQNCDWLLRNSTDKSK